MTNFLGTTDSQPLAIRTNNSEKMRIDASANVGIGIVPQSRFHINGTSWFQGDTTPLPASAGQGIAMGYGSAAYIFAFDYSMLTPRTLLLNHPGGTVGTKVSAENRPIMPGDLLTTSTTPGHAMKCTDKVQCLGATLGKALERLDAGTGVIRVLVTLR